MEKKEEKKKKEDEKNIFDEIFGEMMLDELLIFERDRGDLLQLDFFADPKEKEEILDRSAQIVKSKQLKAKVIMQMDEMILWATDTKNKLLLLKFCGFPYNLGCINLFLKECDLWKEKWHHPAQFKESLQNIIGVYFQGNAMVPPGDTTRLELIKKIKKSFSKFLEEDQKTAAIVRPRTRVVKKIDGQREVVELKTPKDKKTKGKKIEETVDRKKSTGLPLKEDPKKENNKKKEKK
jgi:hypothetical protein